MRYQAIWGAVLVGATLLASGCGGGGGSSTPQPTRAKISFSLLSTQHLPFRITSVSISGSLPAGLSVTTAGQGGWQPVTAGLEGGSALEGALFAQFPVFASYSAPKLMISAVVPDGYQNSAAFGPGEIARLTCGIAGTVSTADIGGTFQFEAFGNDPLSATNPSSLHNYLSPHVSAELLP